MTYDYAFQHPRDYPVVRSARAARRFIEDYNNTDRAHPCCHGHYDCSTDNGGPCLDETLAKFPELAE